MLRRRCWWRAESLASGLARLAAEVAGDEVPDRARRGVLVLGDVGSSILTVRSLPVEEFDRTDRQVKFADAPFVEGAVEAAVVASAGLDLSEVLKPPRKPAG